MQTAEGKLYLFVAIDRTSKFVYVEVHTKTGKMLAAQFLRNLIAAVPYAIHIVLTDRASAGAIGSSPMARGIQFANQEQQRFAFQHIFNRVCLEHGIEHRLTKIKHPWINGQVERMNRTIKDATVKRYHYDSHQQFKSKRPVSYAVLL